MRLCLDSSDLCPRVLLQVLLLHGHELSSDLLQHLGQHAVAKQGALQVVVLVLENACRETGDVDHKALAGQVLSRDANLTRSLHGAGCWTGHTAQMANRNMPNFEFLFCLRTSFEQGNRTAAFVS